jgi:hypothetical protein
VARWWERVGESAGAALGDGLAAMGEGMAAVNEGMSKARRRDSAQTAESKGQDTAAARAVATPRRGGLAEARAAGGKGAGLEGIFTDPELELFMTRTPGGDYAERPSGVAWDVLRRMAKTPPIAAVGNTMCDGLAEFCTPSDNRHLPGFRLRVRGKDARYSPSKAERGALDEAQAFLYNCGNVGDVAELVHRPTLEQCVRAGFWDSFRFDQFCAQVEPAAGWRPGGRFEAHRFYAWPGHTMRLAMPPEDGSRLADDDFKATRYVQIDRHDQVVGSFNGQQMLWGTMRPMTDIENAGYGYSVLEQLVDVLAGWLYGYGYNKAYFKQGANVRGILQFDTEPPAKQQRRFERYFHALVSGVGNAHKVPIAWGAKAQWIGLGQTNKDMEFNQWMDFLTKLLCAICGIDPAEINFTYGNSGQGSAMGTASAAEKIEVSRNRWLRPRVRSLFEWLNKWVVWTRWPELEAVPTGLNERSEEAEQERLLKLVEKTHHVDEVRAMMGDGPLPKKDAQETPGGVILNQVWQQATAPQPEGMGGPEGEGGPEGGPEGEGQGDASDEDVANAEEALFGGAKGKPDDGDGDGDGDPFDESKLAKSFETRQARAARGRVRARVQLRPRED